MRRKISAAATLLLGCTVVVALTASAASGAAADRPAFERLSGIVNYAGFTPALADPTRQVKAIVEVQGEPVGRAQAEARKQGRELSPAEKAAHRNALRGRQEGVRARVGQLGGEVLADYQDAYNGVAVRVALKDLPQLAALPEVTAVHPARVFERTNTAGAQFIGAHEAWNDLGLTGEGVSIAVLDTGVDYYHAHFGGSGDPQDFADDDSTIVEPGTFPTEKVVGGFDFVGDDYNASSSDPAVNTPRPDPDPLDCNGHGTHVAGTAAGFGVLADGSTYTGPYDGTTHSANDFRIGPGVAPEALIYAYRVFGCGGSASEEVIVAALDRALEDGVDVVNMSLGSVFGREDEPSTEASNMLVDNGIVVVASAGNNGPSAYITGAPAVASKAISVAAIDASGATLPGANITLSTGETVVALNANDAELPDGSLPVAVLRESYPDGPISLGCEPSDYTSHPGGVAGKLVVTLRGVCARVARAIYGEQAGAAAVAMINTSTAYPPFEGQIVVNPDTGEPFEVTIPFLGIRGLLGPSPTDDPDRLVAADGGTAMLSPTEVTNPGYKVLASFTSGGPRNVDSAQKPDVTAPGVSVFSAGVGSGNRPAVISGTSMAAPMTAGVAALVTQARPDWSAEHRKAAIVNTADASGDSFASGYDPRLAGSGVVQARRAVDTVAFATTSNALGNLSYGYEPLDGAYSETVQLTLHNTGTAETTFGLAAEFVGPDRGFTLTPSPSSVAVAAGATATVDVTLALDAAGVAALPPAEASNFGALVSVRGVVVATPETAGPGLYPLRVPFLVAPRGLSNVTATQMSQFQPQRGGSRFAATFHLANSGIHAGAADVYQWGISDPADVAGAEGGMDVRAVGVQSLPGEFLGSEESDRTLVFAVNMHGRWSNPSTSEIDIVIDNDGDGNADFFVIGVDLGAVLAGAFDGRFASFIFEVADDGSLGLVNAWVALAPMNGSTMLLPTLASDIGVTSESSTFTYAVGAFSIVPEGLVDLTEGAAYDAFAPAVSNGDFVPLGPGETASLTLSYDRSLVAKTKALGWMVVTLDDPNGAPQADTIPIGQPGPPSPPGPPERPGPPGPPSPPGPPGGGFEPPARPDPPGRP